jgi:Flp pilus assembly protein TadG
MIQYFAVILPVLILFCGFSVDIGMLELKKLRMQSAADAAALGAALEAERGTGNWVNIGLADAAVNGYTNGSNNTTVTVAQMASSGAYNGRYDTIQATISQNVGTIFMGALHGGTYTLTAQSSAIMTPCIYTLGTGLLQTYSLLVYTGSLLSTSCPIYATAEETLYGNIAVEGINISGSSSTSVNSGYIYPSPLFNAPAVSDPLASMASPSFSSCDHTSYKLTSGSATLSPGTYCKGLDISNGATATLSPGLYIITGGANWNNATINGNGITLYFTSGGGGSDGQFLIQNNSTVNISAANDASNGATPAVLVFADRTWTSTSAQDFQVINSTISGDGIWYLPKAGFEIWSSGTYTAPHYLGFVADNIFTAGTLLEPLNNYSYVTGGNPLRRQGALIQ